MFDCRSHFPAEGRLKSQLSSTPVYSVAVRKIPITCADDCSQVSLFPSLPSSLSLLKAIKLFKDLKIDSKGNPA